MAPRREYAPIARRKSPSLTSSSPRCLILRATLSILQPIASRMITGGAICHIKASTNSGREEPDTMTFCGLWIMSLKGLKRKPSRATVIGLTVEERSLSLIVGTGMKGESGFWKRVKSSGKEWSRVVATALIEQVLCRFHCIISPQKRYKSRASIMKLGLRVSSSGLDPG